LSQVGQIIQETPIFKIGRAKWDCRCGLTIECLPLEAQSPDSNSSPSPPKMKGDQKSIPCPPLLRAGLKSFCPCDNIVTKVPRAVSNVGCSIKSIGYHLPHQYYDCLSEHHLFVTAIICACSMVCTSPYPCTLQQGSVMVKWLWSLLVLG
jgi:hypothetical protein